MIHVDDALVTVGTMCVFLIWHNGLAHTCNALAPAVVSVSCDATPLFVSLQEIKGYYNEITHSNLDLIHTLKEELHELKRKEAADDKLMYDIAQENKRMTEPLKRALADIETLTTEREAYRCV